MQSDPWLFPILGPRSGKERLSACSLDDRSAENASRLFQQSQHWCKNDAEQRRRARKLTMSFNLKAARIWPFGWLLQYSRPGAPARSMTAVAVFRG